MMRINILVTGAGAVLGQGILRSLNSIHDEHIIIHSADPDFRSTGHWLAHKNHKVPFANASSYIKVITEIIITEKIDIVLIGTDTELPVFAVNKALLESTTKAKIVVSPLSVIDIANDKWKTAEFLKNAGFEYPKSVLAADKSKIESFCRETRLPYFAKPVDGARSKGIVVIRSEHDLKDVLDNPKNLVIQEFLHGDEEEFTAGCVVLNGKCEAIVTLRRDLRDGNTYRAYYENGFAMYDAFIASVAEKIGVDGPCNFQFRIRNGKPVIFEINARFSGTTPIRLMFGFNEVEAIVRYITEKREIEKPVLKEGMVLRAWSDLFVSADEVKRLSSSNTSEYPKADFYPFYISE